MHSGYLENVLAGGLREFTAGSVKAAPPAYTVTVLRVLHKPGVFLLCLHVSAIAFEL